MKAPGPKQDEQTTDRSVYDFKGDFMWSYKISRALVTHTHSMEVH